MLPHGEWLPWLRKHFEGSRQTADNYRRIASNCQRVSNLDSVRAALAELADPKPKTVDEHDLWDRWVRVVGYITRLGSTPAGRRKEVDRQDKLALGENPRWAWARALSAVQDAVAAGLPAPGGDYPLAGWMQDTLPDAPEWLREIADYLERTLAKTDVEVDALPEADE